MKRTLYILLLLLITSCSPHLVQKRLDYYLNKYPYLSQKDTIKHVDTIYNVTNKVYIDSVRNINHLRKDTFVINKENLTVKTFIYKDSIYIFGQCDTIRDTIFYEKLIPYEKFNYTKLSKWDKFVKAFKKRMWLYSILSILLLIILIVVGYYFKPIISLVGGMFKKLLRIK